jgi:hypothetical protein
VKTRPGWYNQDASITNWYGARVDVRGTSVPFPHSALTLGGVHTFRHREKIYFNEIRGRTNY